MSSRISSRPWVTALAWPSSSGSPAARRPRRDLAAAGGDVAARGAQHVRVLETAGLVTTVKTRPGARVAGCATHALVAVGRVDSHVSRRCWSTRLDALGTVLEDMWPPPRSCRSTVDRTYRHPPERAWAAFTRADLLAALALRRDPEWRVATCDVDAAGRRGLPASGSDPRPDGPTTVQRESATVRPSNPWRCLVARRPHRGRRDGRDLSGCDRAAPAVDGRDPARAHGRRASSERAADDLRTGWEWCLDGLAEQLGTVAHRDRSPTGRLPHDRASPDLRGQSRPRT